MGLTAVTLLLGLGSLYITYFMTVCYVICIIGFSIYYLLNLREINNKIFRFCKSIVKLEEKELSEKEEYKQQLLNQF